MRLAFPSGPLRARCKLKDTQNLLNLSPHQHHLGSRAQARTAPPDSAALAHHPATRPMRACLPTLRLHMLNSVSAASAFFPRPGTGISVSTPTTPSPGGFRQGQPTAGSLQSPAGASLVSLVFARATPRHPAPSLTTPPDPALLPLFLSASLPADTLRGSFVRLLLPVLPRWKESSVRSRISCTQFAAAVLSTGSRRFIAQSGKASATHSLNDSSPP